jgi:hypothetical protein
VIHGEDTDRVPVSIARLSYAVGQATPQIQTFQCSSGCATGQYVIEACDAVAGRDWLCAECSTCEEGSVVEKPCSGEENTECRPCR